MMVIKRRFSILTILSPLTFLLVHFPPKKAIIHHFVTRNRRYWGQTTIKNFNRKPLITLLTWRSISVVIDIG
jgi:hypothetical protein